MKQPKREPRTLAPFVTLFLWISRSPPAYALSLGCITRPPTSYASAPTSLGCISQPLTSYTSFSSRSAWRCSASSTKSADMSCVGKSER